MSSSGSTIESYLIPLEEINLATENFSPQRCIGSGGFGKVYRGQLSEDWQNQTVAIKRLDPNSYQGEREFRNEIEMISKFHHENIISFLGYNDEGKEMIIVYKYASNGSLDHHLQDPTKRRCITWIQRLEICIGAARGLNYLHSGLGKHNRVIHRDVKSANILLDDNFVAKVCDFGLSKLGPKNQPNTQLYTNVAGTQYYLDPTYHESNILTKESDVYSFGVVLFEMLSGMLVYSRRSIGDDRPQFLMNFVRRYRHSELDNLIDPYISDQIESRSFDIFKEIAYQCISLSSMERPKMYNVVERIEEALDIQRKDNLRQENVAALLECVKENLGFSHGKPIAAFTIYKCLLHWKYLEAERTNVFDILMQIIISAIEDQHNSSLIAYWLSNASTLLFLIGKSLEVNDAPNYGIMRPRFQSSPSDVLKDFAEAEAEAKAQREAQQVKAKYPALHFKQQLTSYLEKLYGIIRDNLKKELGLVLDLCIQAPQKTKGVVTSGQSSDGGGDSNYWHGIVDSLKNLLNTLKENCVPPIIVQKIFAQNFSYINVQLFNSILLRRECCTVSNGEYVKDGLAELEQWCCHEEQVYAGSAWDELKHIRQAVGFMVIDKKQEISYAELTYDLCPILKVEQLYRIYTTFWDENFNLRTEPRQILSIMRTMMAEDPSSNTRDSFLLEDDCSVPFSVDDLSISLQVNDFINVKPAGELSKYEGFQFLYNQRSKDSFQWKGSEADAGFWAKGTLFEA